MDTVHHRAHTHEETLGSTPPLRNPSDPARSGARLVIRPNYLPPQVMSPICTTRTPLRTSTCLSPTTRCKCQPPVLRQKTLQRLSQQKAYFLSSDAGRERHPVPSEDIHQVPEGEKRKASEVREYYCRQSFEALHHQERQFEEAAPGRRWEADRFPQAETARVATQTVSQVDACFSRLENNVAADFDERQRTLSRTSTSTQSATRSPDSRSSRRITEGMFYIRAGGEHRNLSRTLKPQLNEKDFNKLRILFKGVQTLQMKKAACNTIFVHGVPK